MTAGGSALMGPQWSGFQKTGPGGSWGQQLNA